MFINMEAKEWLEWVDEHNKLKKEHSTLTTIIAGKDAEIERLMEALIKIANSVGIDGCGYTTGEGHSDCVWIARNALKVNHE